MKVAFLLRPWPVFGGGETVTIALANEFVKRNISTYVFYTKKNNKGGAIPFIDKRIKQILVPGVISDEDNYTFTHNEINKARDFLISSIEKNDINIVINQWWPVETTFNIPAKVIKCLHMCLFMTSNYDNLGGNCVDFIKKILGRKIYTYMHKLSRCRQVEKYLPYVDKYIFLAPCYKKEYLAFRSDSIYKNKLDYCYNPLPFDNHSTDKPNFRKSNDVLFVGRMYESHKHVSEIIDIWANIESDRKYDNWNLKLVGDGPQRLIYESKVSSLGLKRVTFYGFQQPRPFYENAKIFLMTSSFEGWGMTLVESQQFGVVPIAYNNFSSLQDIIKTGYNGVIVESGNQHKYISSLKYLMANDSYRSLLASNAYISCKKYAINGVVEKWKTIFSELMSE